MSLPFFLRKIYLVLVCALTTAHVLAQPSAPLQNPSSPGLQLSRPIRTWEFLPVVGSRAALFGKESGRMEAWVYPLKIFRNLHLIFHVDDRALPAESLARTLTVHPESATILYVGDSFRVRETMFVPFDQPGVVIQFAIQTEAPLEIEARFIDDFQLEWPAALGGTFIDWDPKENAFFLGDESGKFAAFVGSPSAVNPRLSYETNYSSTDENSLRLGITTKGKDTKLLVVAGSVQGRLVAQKSYRQLVASDAELLRQSSDYYQAYLARTVSLDLPDTALQQAYDWARISTIQGMVNNPYLGTGLVAGYRTSGIGQRPGFAWFFGRDSFWTSFALNAEGDYASSRTAIDFISRYQRPDGKVPHEVSQAAGLVPWFRDYPYPYASADATPLFILAMNDYAVQSGDVQFVRQKWDNIWRAYQFLRSTYDEQGLARNFGIGHGWVEGGPLLPVKSEYYQAGLGVASLRALANLARLIGKEDISKQASAEFDRQKSVLEQAFWSPDKNIYAFGLKTNNQRADEPSVLATVPMWFGLPEQSHAEEMIGRLAEPDLETDWGMRIISSQSPLYDGSGYHFGSVWPLFTGWASVSEYRYHREFPAYSNLRSNALLGFDGSLGHFTEVLSGDYNESFETSSPHQIWSAAMVISPILRGMFGLKTDVQAHTISLTPHVPANWTSFALHNVRLNSDQGPVALEVQYQKSIDRVEFRISRQGPGECSLVLSPAFSLRTRVISAELNGRPVLFKIQANENDQHALMRFPVPQGSSRLVVRLKDDFGLTLSTELPPLGGVSHDLKIVSESWNAARTELTLDTRGRTGESYKLAVWNPAQIATVDSAELDRSASLLISFPGASSDSYQSQRVVIHFGKP